jgi:hypothetical protein
VSLPPEVQSRLDERRDKKWDSFSWVTLRALISSSNHAVNLAAPRLVGDLRHQWNQKRAVQWPNNERILAIPDAEKFVIVGDPGEQDTSQYVLVPALQEHDGQAEFFLICSDVIYPSGDVNDYVDGFFVPYKALKRRIYALPGNHDWYDGLFGFMYHFCGAERLPWRSYYSGARSPREWLFRFLWRRPSRAHGRRLKSYRNSSGQPSQPPVQPGSYFAIETKHLLLVCIDTGILGDIDNEQGQWLVDVSHTNDKPKVLVTGKPLVVNLEHKPCRITDHAGHDAPVVLGEQTTGGEQTRFTSVDEIVRHEPFGYVASIGGDIHNFQHYRVVLAEEGRPFDYIVSGGGGAYMSATHPIPCSQSTAELSFSPEEPHADQARQAISLTEHHLYPTREQSLAYFADRLLPRLWRLVRAVLLLVIGLVVAGVWAVHGDDDVTHALVGYGALVLAGCAVVQTFLPAALKHGSRYRAFVSVTALVAGAELALAGWWLKPDRFSTHLIGWSAITAGGAFLAWAMRRTGWWRERAEHFTLAMRWRWLAVVLCAVLVIVTCAVTHDPWLIGAAALVALASIAGWKLRKHHHWSQGSAQVVAYVVQFIVTMVVLDRLILPAAARDELHASLIAVVVVPLVAIVATAALAAPIAALVHRPAQRMFVPAWAGWTAELAVPFVFIFGALAGYGVVSLFSGRDATHAVLVTVASVLALPVAAFGLDWLRRLFGRSYPLLPIVLTAAAAWAVPRYLPADRDLVPSWLGREAAAGAVVVAAALLGIVIVHLVFLGAQTMIWHRPTHSDGTQLTSMAAREAIRWRNGDGFPDASIRWITNIVFPGSSHPHGPIQQFVAEIFDTDAPPFYKNFLVLETSDGHLSVRVHAVTGEVGRPSSELVGTIPIAL